MSSQVFDVGDNVRFRLAGRSIVGRLLEDRGPIGVGGRRLYLIRYDLGEETPYEIELPAAEIEGVEPKKAPA
jgi:hypothetical protein